MAELHETGAPHRRAVLELTPDELTSAVTAAGGKPYHARSILRWVLVRGAAQFEDLTDLPRATAERLRASLDLLDSNVVERREAPDGSVKLLVGLRDGQSIETVRMPSGRGATVCLSTQVGCPIECAFCASGIGGVVRNLGAHEIVEQFLHARRIGPLTRAVVMGMGEPLLNLESLMRALDTITHPEGIGFSSRRITISTVGLPDRIRALAAAKKPWTLAVSLHASTDELRRSLVPAAAKIPIDALLRASQDYFEQTGREVTFEYVLLGGVNDSPSDAARLGRLLGGLRSTVNLIPFNPVPGLDFRRPAAEHVRAFHATLRRAGVVATVRWSKGLEADAACGQLRARRDSRTKSVTSKA